MKKLITLILCFISFSALAQIPMNPTPRTPVSGFARKVIWDRDLRAYNSFWIPVTMSTTPSVVSIDSAGSNLQLLSNGRLAVSKGLGTGFWEYLTTAGGTFTGSVTATSFIGALTGNSTTATSLANTRTIWGQNFNGTANVSGALSGVTGITATGNYNSTSATSNSINSTSTGTGTNSSMSLTNDVGSIFVGYNYGSLAAGNELGISRAGNANLLYVGAGTLAIGSRNATDISFATNATERMRLTSAGAFSLATATASTIASFDASKNIVSLPTATYPNLTELSYVKGVTSGVQAQLNAKGSGTVTSVSVATANGVSGSVATPTTTPAITLTLGAITPTSVTTTGVVDANTIVASGGFLNSSSALNSGVYTTNDGVQISRDVLDSQPALTVNNFQGTGKIARYMQGGVTTVATVANGAPTASTDLIRTQDIAITNTTTVVITSATLTSTYPNAIVGFQVICPNILAGGLIYTKYDSGWVQTPITIAP